MFANGVSGNKRLPSTQFVFMYYVYVIKNNKKGMIYIGYTDNLKRRLKEHKDKIPELMYYEAYRNELDAREREGKLKQRGQAVRHLKKRIKRSLE